MFINNFDPVAFSVFSLEFRWYSLAYVFGILIGWILAKKIFIKSYELREKFDDYITFLIIGIIVGGRLGYVIFYNFDSLVYLFNRSSLTDRIARINCGIQFFLEANVLQSLFGYGIDKQCYIDKLGNDIPLGFSSGYFKILTHRGIIPLLLILYLIYTVLKKNFLTYILVLLIFLVIIRVAAGLGFRIAAIIFISSFWVY